MVSTSKQWSEDDITQFRLLIARFTLGGAYRNKYGQITRRVESFDTEPVAFCLITTTYLTTRIQPDICAMSKDEDSIPESYTYKWTPKSATTLQEFLGKVRIECCQNHSITDSHSGMQYKPSMVQNDGTKPVCPPRLESVTAHVGQC